MSSWTNAGENTLNEMYVVEYVRYTTNRRPKPNAIESVSITSGLRIPSFKYRSGWYFMGSLKCLESCTMDLNKKVRTESMRSPSYWPSITEYNCSFWNIVTIVFIVVSSHVGNSFRNPSGLRGKYDGGKGSPRGATKCQRINSLTTALIYGKKGRSPKSGRRFRPTTASISAWAFFWTSGCSAIARNMVCTVDVV